MTVLALSLGGSGCALFSNSSGLAVRECVLPSDQTGTLSGHWPVTPIPVAFQAGAFSAADQAAVISAADTWNNFTSVSIGSKLIDYGEVGSPRTTTASKPNPLCSQGIVSGGKFTGQVAVFNHRTWPYPNLPDAIALTSFCPVSASPLNNFYMAIMEVNSQNFFATGKRLPDLQSIMTHEFGHLLGLNHSCSGTAATGVPKCSAASTDETYLDAVMFPVFGFSASGVGEQRRILNSNDQGRANCLYLPADSGE